MSPAPPRTLTDPTSVHPPFFEWGNTSMDPVFSTEPTNTRHVPTIPNPTLSVIPPMLYASSSSQNLATPVFGNGGFNSTIRSLPFIPLAAERPSQPHPYHFRPPQPGYHPHNTKQASHLTIDVLAPQTPLCARVSNACTLPDDPHNDGLFFCLKI
ncbi:hypothetical protein EDD18DRAFT_1363556 [Armillaria luteobubalina]|uniref:Uncharacterized protein n=1 Tax=Armillaria luteobubalina TaxID=153913 RepID=A0AA39PB51_9AGAR|nr:hypothetical protein EDD18DRAFT_1363556 [Armillaria luteobubalina]